MRFKTGTRVEVLKERGVPCHTWHRAEIISGNGHYYSVRYDHALGTTSEDAVERVPRNAIRPVPHPGDDMEIWVVGDVVEVFDDISWKPATILKILYGNCYEIQLLGCCKEYRVHKSYIRVPRSCPDYSCILVAKGSATCKMKKYDKPSHTFKIRKKCDPAPPLKAKRKVQARDGYLGLQRNNVFQEAHFVPSRSLKRVSPFSSSNAEAYTVNCWKRRVLEKQSGNCRVASGYPCSLSNKVDVVACPQKNLGEICMHAPCSNQTSWYFHMEMVKQNDSVECFLPQSSEPQDSVSSDASSVGSCSVVSSSPNKLFNHVLADPSQEADVLSSDAESFCGHGDEEEECTHLSPKEDVSVELHRLELHAYRCTLGALYASGPLNWEKEALLTNLRFSLHISNDEHLMELRNLISGGINTQKS